METRYEIPSISDRTLERNALAVALASRAFSRTPRSCELLKYLCERHFAGEAQAVKEYTIATDVFSRPAHFDQSTDAIVRVEMHRLRKRLKGFYADEGRGQEPEITIPCGRYIPEFHYSAEPALLSSSALAQTSPPLTEMVPIAAPSLTMLPSSRSRMWVALAIGVLVCSALFAGFPLWRNNSAGAAGKALSVSATFANSADSRIAILCGPSQATHRDSGGREWSADKFFSGGVALASSGRPIYRTRDQFLFRGSRSGDFSYRIPLQAGVYEMRLYFADQTNEAPDGSDGGEDTRVFTVLMNRVPILKQFDVIADAGPNTADVRVFKDVAPAADGFLHLDFKGLRNTAILNAIEVVSGSTHRLGPIRVSTAETAYTDKAGQAWMPDDYYLNGRIAAFHNSSRGILGSRIYSTERYGNFSYAIPVAAGRYAANLYFKPSDPEVRRVFNVECNGSTLLHDFDLSESSGHSQGIVKTLHGLVPNSQGKLLLSFIPVSGYAALSGLEIIDETN